MGTRNKGYKRSWKNLLLNKRYQLRFTLFMVGLSALLMLALGLWVLEEAEEATAVDEIASGSPDCEIAPPEIKPAGKTPPTVAPDLPGKDAPAPQDGTADGASDGAKAPAPDGAKAPAPDGAKAPAPDDGVKEPDDGAKAPAPDDGVKEPADGAKVPAPADGAKEPPPTDGAGAESGADDTTAEAGDDTEERERPRRPVAVELSDIQYTPEAQEEARKAKALRLARCQHQKKKLAQVHDGYERIRLVLIGMGLFLVIGLTIFGIKMTHRVAGPLYKVTLYFEKLRKGVYDEVYRLRKGDQLVEFYDQFKEAHGGIRAMEEKDVEVLKSLIEAVDKADLKDRSPELAELVDEVRAMLKRKEESLK